MAKGKCTVAFLDSTRCTNEGKLARGMCSSCYTWSRRRGWANPGTRRRHAKPGQRLNQIRKAACATVTECIIMTGFSSRPKVHFGEVQMMASRVVWIIANGDPGELHVLHTCHRGEEGCINIRHLYLGDNETNMADMWEAGRHSKGADRWNTGLDDDQVRELRRMYGAGGVSYPRLGEMFGISGSQVARIVKRENWKHVD